MSFLTGPMRKHLDGHKELTNHEDVLKAAENAQTDLGKLIRAVLKNMDKIKD